MVYRKPEIHSFDTREVVESLGPAIALLSGGSTPARAAISPMGAMKLTPDGRP